MKKSVIFALCLILISATIVGCSHSKPKTPTQTEGGQAFVPADHLPTELTQLLQANRADVFQPTSQEAIDAIKSYQTAGLDATKDAEIADELKQANDTSGDAPETLTHAQIQNELDYLFDLLKYGYGGYGYAGGDAVFVPLKQAMEGKLSTMPDPVITADYVNRLLAPFLRSTIVDNHFIINGSSLVARMSSATQTFFYSDDFYFTKSKDDYITTIKGEQYKLASNSVYLLPTIKPDGELTLYLGRMIGNDLGNVNTKGSVDLVNIKTGESISQSIYLKTIPGDYSSTLSTDVYSETEQDGIPVLASRALYTEDGKTDALDEFAATGLALRNNKIQILDLRANEGGNSAYAMQWVKNYTGVNPESLFASSILLSTTARELFQSSTLASPMPGTVWSQVLTGNPRLIPNDNLLIVLIDGYCCSSGEDFVAYLRQLDNVIFVGVPTAGCLTVGNVATPTLPESKLSMSFGIKLNVRSDLSNYEGVGFAPDLWVSPGESMNRVVKFIENYGLNQK